MHRFFRFSVLTLAIIAAPASWAYSQATPKAPTTYPEIEDGVKKLQQGQYDPALKDFEEACRKHPELPPAQILMYNYFAQMNDGNKARLALEKAVLASPTDPEAYVIMGNIAVQERRITEAELAFTKARELLANFAGAPQRKTVLDPSTRSGLAQVDELREKWEAAEKQLNELLLLQPKNANVMQRLARAMFWQKRPGDALAMLHKAKEADKNVLTPEAALAGFYEQYPDHTNAVIWFDKALNAAKDDLATHRVVAFWALETGDLAKAKEQAEACLKIDRTSLDAMLLRGVVALYEEDYTHAEEWFQTAHLASPGNFAATNNLALALCEEVDPITKLPDTAKLQRAFEYANTNYQSNSKNADACSTLGWVLFKRKDYDQAIMALRQAAQAGGGNLSADTAFYLSEVFYTRGNKDEAKKILEQIIKNEKPFSKRKAAKELYTKLAQEVTTPASSKLAPEPAEALCRS